MPLDVDTEQTGGEVEHGSELLSHDIESTLTARLLLDIDLIRHRLTEHLVQATG
jgi:hypothetical protein